MFFSVSSINFEEAILGGCGLYKIICCILVFFSIICASDPIGYYRCKTVWVEQYRNGTVSRKRISAKSLYLNITRNKIFVYGIESGRNICKDLNVDKIFRDTLFFNPRLNRDSNDKARLFFKRDTLAGDYNFLDNGSSDSVVVKILTTRVSVSTIDRVKRQCRQD
jgi:hypothetical protein